KHGHYRNGATVSGIAVLNWFRRRFNHFAGPRKPVFPEASEEFVYHRPFDHNTCVPPFPAFEPQMKTAVFVGDVQSAGKCLLIVNYNKFPVVPVNIIRW